MMCGGFVVFWAFTAFVLGSTLPGEWSTARLAMLACVSAVPAGIVALMLDSDLSSPGYKTLKSLPAHATVVPVYNYGGTYYEAPAMSAQSFRNSVTKEQTRKLHAIPYHASVIQGQVYQPDDAIRVDNWPTRHNTPRYSIDGRLIGYRYFNRDAEGNLRSVSGVGLASSNWGHGENRAHKKPTANNRAGLYAAYSEDHPVLGNYEPFGIKAEVWFDGDVAHGENGVFRGEHGEVTQILEEPPLKPGQKPLKFHKDRTKGRF